MHTFDEEAEQELKNLVLKDGMSIESIGRLEIERMEDELHELDRGKNIGGRSWNESKKIWEIAAPAILTAVAQFSFEFVTAAFIGHLGEVELAAVSVVQNVIEGFVYGIMVCITEVLRLCITEFEQLPH